MNARSFVIAALFIAAISTSMACAEAPARVKTLAPPPKTAEQKKDVNALVEGNNGFAFDLYAQLKSIEGNLFLSPYSISTALAMTYAGARGNTEKQMAQALHFRLASGKLHPAFQALIDDLNARSSKNYELLVANALWGQQGYEFLQPFLDLTREHYHSGLNEVDFMTAAEAARRKINAWVEERTKDKIKELIPPKLLTPATTLVLTNAIYFKGKWASEFDKAQSGEAPFILATGETVKATLMSQSDRFPYYEEEDFQALELPYRGDDLAMTILLPRKADGLATLEKSLTATKLAQCISQLRKRKAFVLLPRFKMTSQFSLADTLKAMGMTDAFTAKADFSAMTEEDRLFISAVIHKAYIEVNEEGTEAAAATAVVMERASVSIDRPVLFKADHPFFFVIRDTRTNSLLFMGRVMNPTK